MEFEYRVIDTTNILDGPVYITCDKTKAFHEMLHRINTIVDTVKRYNGSIELATFDSIYVAETIYDSDKPNLMVRNVYRYNVKNNLFMGDMETLDPSFDRCVGKLAKTIQNKMTNTKFVKTLETVSSEFDTRLKPTDYSIYDLVNTCEGKLIPKKESSKELTAKEKIRDLNIDNIISALEEDNISLINDRKIPTVVESDDQSSEESMSIADTMSIDDIDTESVQDEEIEDMTQEELDQLRKKMEVMEELCNRKKQELEDIKEKLEADTSNLVDYRTDLDDRKRQLRVQEEKDKERRRVFDHDVRLYYRIKGELKNEVIESVPPLFEKKYPILKFMDEKELLFEDDSESYDTYLVLYNETYPEKPVEYDGSGYVPHNINYLSPEERVKYENIKNKNFVSEFVSNHANVDEPKRKSYEEIIDELSVSDSDEESADEDSPTEEDFERASNMSRVAAVLNNS